MGFFSNVAAAVSGAGSIAGAVTAVAKVVGQAMGLVHDHNVDVGGQNKIIAADNAATARVNEDVAQAAVDTTDRVVADRLRNGEF